MVLSPSLNRSKQVVIIGGGFAGIAAAVFLDGLGVEITLLERKPILGGRTYAFQDKKTGSWIDNGQHLLMGAYHETLRLLEHLGATRHLRIAARTRVPLVTEENKKTAFRSSSLPPPWNLLFSLVGLKGLSLKDKIGFLRLGRSLLKWRANPQSSSLGKSVTEWLTSMGQSDYAQRNFWDLLTLATLNDQPRVASAEMLAVVLAKGFMGEKKDGSLIIPKGTLNDLLATPARAYLEIRGHHIRTASQVKKVHILDNRVCGIELATGEMMKGDLYISAIPFNALLRIIPEGFVEGFPYFRNLENLKTSPIVSINLWFDREIIDEDFIGLAGKKIHWYFNRTRILGEKGPPFHTVGVVSGAYSLIDLSREDIVAMALQELKETFPETHNAILIHSLVNKEREATLSPTIESSLYRPPQKSPFPNFYVIGDWTRTGYPATIESAVRSARLAVDDIVTSFSPADETRLPIHPPILPSHPPA